MCEYLNCLRYIKIIMHSFNALREAEKHPLSGATW